MTINFATIKKNKIFYKKTIDIFLIVCYTIYEKKQTEEQKIIYKHYKIYFTDKVYLGTVSFKNKTRQFIKDYFARYITRHNNGHTNTDYKISFKNIKRVF